MDVAYINPFIASVRNVFETMIKVPFTLGKPYLKRGDERLYKLFRLSAVLEMSGDVTGVVVLNFTEGTALALVGGLTGTPPTAINADVIDAVGEIGNMVAGNARKDFPPGEHKVSTPKVKRPYEVIYPTHAPVIMIPVDTGAGRCILEVGLRTPVKKVA